MNDQVLVTGASGFIATHCIAQLLEKGYAVRGTLRTMGRADEVREAVGRFTSNIGNLTFAEADLTKDEGWREAAQGCPLILHVASPFPMAVPKNENDLIIPARDGALRLLRAANETGARKVVLTSSMAAVAYGRKKEPGRAFNENDWSDVKGPGMAPYTKSKTIAEKAAWDYVEKEKPSFALATINPGAVFGPVLSSDIGTSVQAIQMLLQGAMPGLPRLAFPIVDVRDVADLHIRAMEQDAANGNRFVCVNGTLWFVEMANAIKKRFPKEASKVPTKVLPNVMMKIAALVGQFPKQGVRDLGRYWQGNNTQARTLLGWNPRSAEDAVIATAESLIELKLT